METTLTSQQLVAFLKLLEEKKMTSSRFTSVLSSGILADVLDPNADLSDRDAVRAVCGLDGLAIVVVPDTFHLTIDYSQSLEAMIAAGRYDWKNSDITAKRFPIEGNGVTEFECRYFHFDREMSSGAVIERIMKADMANPWVPAKIEHVLSHGKNFPEEQRKFPIIGLGSVAEVDGDRFVPVLRKDDSRRGLSLRWFDGDWNPVYRFLAVRKASAS